jgi:hypothetical protein
MGTTLAPRGCGSQLEGLGLCVCDFEIKRISFWVARAS